MPTDPAPPSSHDNQPGVERLLVLSDGVVAISLTLLVLQLQVPAAAQVPDSTSASELAAQLGKGADELISYVISFYVIAQFWLVHHRVFRRVAGQRESLAWWNFAFLFTITLMPGPRHDRKEQPAILGGAGVHPGKADGQGDDD
jgi:uncharacterized membrane protein